MEYNLNKCTITIGGLDLGEFVHGDLLQVTIRPSKISRWRWRWPEFRARATAYKARMRWAARIRKYWSLAQLPSELSTFNTYTTPRDDRPIARSYAIWAGIGVKPCV